MHTFVYARVSTAEQTNDNQLLEIEQSGYQADTVYSDTVSGKDALYRVAGEASLKQSISEASRIGAGIFSNRAVSKLFNKVFHNSSR